jgi:hypothetical protein
MWVNLVPRDAEKCGKRGAYKAESKTFVYYKCGELGLCENQAVLGKSTLCKVDKKTLSRSYADLGGT